MTDYERACEINDYAAAITVGPGRGIILGDEPAATAWWPITNIGGGYLVQWHSAESEDDMLRAIPEPTNVRWLEGQLSAELASDNPILFDSADSGVAPDPCLIVPLPRGIYTVNAAQYRASPQTAMVLIQFAKQGLVTTLAP